MPQNIPAPAASGHQRHVDPRTTTRTEFTRNLTETPPPEGSAPQYAHLWTSLNELLTLLAEHPAMAPNLEQTYSTPANRKTKIYFLWDFVGRTRGMMATISPSLPRVEKGQWQDVKGRAMFTKVLIDDENSPRARMMFAGCEEADIGDEVKQASNRVVDGLE